MHNAGLSNKHVLCNSTMSYRYDFSNVIKYRPLLVLPACPGDLPACPPKQTKVKGKCAGVPSIYILQPAYWVSAHRVLILHVLQSCASSLFTCFSFMYFLITSLHLSIGLPLSFSVHPRPSSMFYYYIFFSLSLHMS